MFHKQGEYVVQDFSSQGVLRNINQQNLHFITQEAVSYAPQSYVTRYVASLVYINLDALQSSQGKDKDGYRDNF
jgi:hypothetical protein